MKKLVVLLLIAIYIFSLMSFAIAEQGEGNSGASISNEDECNVEQDCIDKGLCDVGIECTCSKTNKCYTGIIAEDDDEENETEDGEDDEDDSEGKGVGLQVKSGNYTTNLGQAVKIFVHERNRIRLESKNVSADCECNMTQENETDETGQNKTKLKVKLSNGKGAEIKIMPDKASENALNMLKLKVCSEENKCSIELKEVGEGEEIRLAYELQTEREAKIMGLLKANIQVKAQVDAESGEVIQIEKPWWAFLASESEE